MITTKNNANDQISKKGFTREIKTHIFNYRKMLLANLIIVFAHLTGLSGFNTALYSYSRSSVMTSEYNTDRNAFTYDLTIYQSVFHFSYSMSLFC